MSAVLDGSVRKAGNRIRVSVQLVNVADSSHLWSETYDRTLEDVFAVQDDIAQSVVKELRITLLGHADDSDASGQARADVAAAPMGHGRSPEAHRLYLQGKYFVDRLTGEDTARGIRYLEQALALDVSHAAAWSALSRAHTHSGGYGWAPVGDSFRRAREAAVRAIEQAPDLAEAHIALALVLRWHDRDWSGAEASSRRALELAPENADALRACAWMSYHVGRYDESEQFWRRAIDQDPLSTDALVGIGLVYRSTHRHSEAEAVFRKALEIHPHEVRLQHLLALALTQQGRHDEAIAAAEREPYEWARLFSLAYTHHRAGHPAESDAALRELEARHASDSAFQIAAVYGVRGEVDVSFAWLDRAIAENDPGVSLARVEPSFESLHSDPRWPALLARLGFTD